MLGHKLVESARVLAQVLLGIVRLVAGVGFMLAVVWLIRDVGLVALVKAFHGPGTERINWTSVVTPGGWLTVAVLTLATLKVCSSILFTRLCERRWPVVNTRTLLRNGFSIT